MCPSMAIRRYATRLSGPLRDRIDIDLAVARVATSRAMSGGRSALSSAEAQQRVIEGRERATARLKGTPWRLNGDVPGTWLRQTSQRIDQAARVPLERALERGALTLRGYDRVLRLAWTMADLEGRERPGLDEVGRALVLKRGGAS